MDPLIWPSLLLIIGLVLVVLEVFVPSGGIMGFLSLSCVLTGVVLAFVHGGLEVGLIFVTIAAVGVPTVLVVAFRYWPRTPLGKRLLLDVPTSESVLPDTPLKQQLRSLVGKIGTARSLMLPSGAVLIDGITVDALSEGVPIEPGQRVKVIAVAGNHVVVRRAEDDEREESPSGDDVLSQPIETLGLRPIDDPLA